MNLSMGEKIRIVAKKRKMSIKYLSLLLGESPTNLYNKLARDNFDEKDLKKIAEKLDCQFIGIFKMNDTGEEI